MLDFLVTSKARKALLRLLWNDGASGAVMDLAKRAGVKYAAAYNELKAMEAAGLAVSRGAGRSVVFTANEASPYAELVRKLVEEPAAKAKPQADDSNVVANLQRYGAPLQANVTLEEALSLEETLARSLIVSHRNATVLRVLPLLFAKHASELDVDALRKRAATLRQSRSLGFVLDLAADLSGDKKLRAFSAALRDRRVKVTESYFTNLVGKYALALAKKNTPPAARRWRYVLNMPMESFASLYEKFAEAS